MNAVGIDVSKGKSTVAVIQPFGVVIAEPFDVFHTDQDLKELVAFLKTLTHRQCTPQRRHICIRSQSITYR